MKTRFLVSSAMCLVFATAAFAQSPSTDQHSTACQ